MIPPRDVPPPNWLRLGPLAPAEPTESLLDRACFLLSRLAARPVFGRYDLTWLGPMPYGTPVGERLKPGTLVKVTYEQPDIL